VVGLKPGYLAECWGSACCAVVKLILHQSSSDTAALEAD